MNATDETIIISAEFPKELAFRARIAAALAGISRSELIRRATDEYTAHTSQAKAIEPSNAAGKSASTRA